MSDSGEEAMFASADEGEVMDTLTPADDDHGKSETASRAGDKQKVRKGSATASVTKLGKQGRKQQNKTSGKGDSQPRNRHDNMKVAQSTKHVNQKTEAVPTGDNNSTSVSVTRLERGQQDDGGGGGGDKKKNSSELASNGVSGATVPTSGDATVPTSGDATVPTSGDATVPTSGGVIVPTSGGATVPTSGGVIVPTSGDASVPTSGGVTVPTSGGATVPTSGGVIVPTSGGVIVPTSGDATASITSNKLNTNKLNKCNILEVSAEISKTHDDDISKTHDDDDADGDRLRLHSEISSPGNQDISREVKNDIPGQEEDLNRAGESSAKGSGQGLGWGWSNWGTSLLSAATNSVQTFTHQVGDGFSTIIDTVEATLKVPQTEEIVSQDKTLVTKDVNREREDAKSQTKLAVPETREADKQHTDKQQADKQQATIKDEEVSASKGWFSTWGMTDLAKKVQDTGKSLACKGQSLMSEGFDAMENLASGGIDMLESIGKKTYNTLSEHDPAFRKTRQFLNPNRGSKASLSSILREAKDKAEQEMHQAQEREEARKAHFGSLFDDYQGLSHLEALEILSNQSEKKVHKLLAALAQPDIAAIKPTLISIKEAFQMEHDDDDDNADATQEQDFPSLVSRHLSELELGTAPDKLTKVHEMVRQWILDGHHSARTDSTKEVHEKSIQSLAELTAKGVEQFHKAGELVLLERDMDKDCLERAHSLARLTGVLCHEIGHLAGKFAEILNNTKVEGDQGQEVTTLVTNVYLEATNSSTYIQDAFQLLLPVLQQAAIEHSVLSRQT